MTNPISDFETLLDMVRSGQNMVDESTPKPMADLLDDIEQELMEAIDYHSTPDYERAG